MKLQISTAILLSLTTTTVMAQCPAENCWCVPDGDVCPPKGDRTDVRDPADSTPVIEFYESLTPSDDGLFELYPPGCEPFPIVAAFFNKTICEGVVAQSGKEIDSSMSSCTIDYSGEVCDGGTYSVYDETYDVDRMLKKSKKDDKKDKKNKKAKKDKKGKKDSDKNEASSRGGLTHVGSCGVCSSAQDHVALMSQDIKEGHIACAAEMIAAIQDPSLFDTLIPTFDDCHRRMGFSDGCARMWSSQWFAAILEVMTAFSAVAPGSEPTTVCERCGVACFGSDPPDALCFTPCVDESTHSLGPCVQCEYDMVQPIFARYAGRTRRSSGIVDSALTYPCSETVDLGQPILTCPAP